jgi:hypothetical protein
MFAGKRPDPSIEAHVRHVERGRAGVYLVDAIDRRLHLGIELLARALVEVLLINALTRLVLVDAALDPPGVSPLRRTRAIGAEQIE